MFDFISIGEMLIDFSPYGTTEERAFQLNPGGAPANVACVLAKLGANTAFIGKVGADPFGQACADALTTAGTSTDLLIRDPLHPTTLAFVCLDETGNREFSFYRDNTADVNLNLDDLKAIGKLNTKIFHFGSVSLTAEPSASTVITAVEQAKAQGITISYDPNLRLPLWKDADTAKKAILDTLHLADILKISEEEAVFLFGLEDCEEACRHIYDTYHTPLILVTRGPDGCVAMIGGDIYTSYAYDLKVVDTTGAGDSFLAGIVLHLLRYNKPLDTLTADEANTMLTYANAVGSLVTTKKGAIPAIPTAEEVADCIQHAPLLKR